MQLVAVLLLLLSACAAAPIGANVPSSSTLWRRELAKVSADYYAAQCWYIGGIWIEGNCHDRETGELLGLVIPTKEEMESPPVQFEVDQCYERGGEWRESGNCYSKTGEPLWIVIPDSDLEHFTWDGPGGSLYDGPGPSILPRDSTEHNKNDVGADIVNTIEGQTTAQEAKIGLPGVVWGVCGPSGRYVSDVSPAAVSLDTIIPDARISLFGHCEDITTGEIIPWNNVPPLFGPRLGKMDEPSYKPALNGVGHISAHGDDSTLPDWMLTWPCGQNARIVPSLGSLGLRIPPSCKDLTTGEIFHPDTTEFGVIPEDLRDPYEHQTIGHEAKISIPFDFCGPNGRYVPSSDLSVMVGGISGHCEDLTTGKMIPWNHVPGFFGPKRSEMDKTSLISIDKTADQDVFPEAVVYPFVWPPRPMCGPGTRPFFQGAGVPSTCVPLGEWEAAMSELAPPTVIDEDQIADPIGVSLTDDEVAKRSIRICGHGTHLNLKTLHCDEGNDSFPDFRMQVCGAGSSAIDFDETGLPSLCVDTSTGETFAPPKEKPAKGEDLDTENQFNSDVITPPEDPKKRDLVENTPRDWKPDPSLNIIKHEDVWDKDYSEWSINCRDGARLDLDRQRCVDANTGGNLPMVITRDLAESTQDSISTGTVEIPILPSDFEPVDIFAGASLVSTVNDEHRVPNLTTQ